MARSDDPGADSLESLEETATADREAEAATLIVDRHDSTVIVERAATPEGTLAVTRDRARPGASGLPSGGRRRRGMTMPPVPTGYGRGAIEAVGPGAVDRYQPRAMPEPPLAEPTLTGVDATRSSSAGLPSVERRARRSGLIALTLFAASCVLSLVGLIALGVGVFGL